MNFFPLEPQVQLVGAILTMFFMAVIIKNKFTKEEKIK